MSHLFTVNLPDIGEGVVEGEVVEWLKNVGDPIEQDEPIVIVMTDKATVELPAPHPGKLAKQYFKPGQTALLDKPLYDIELSEPLEIKQEEPEQKKEKPAPKKEIVVHSGDKALATPATRKLAKDLGIDINAVPGNGPSGRVLKEDLREKSASPILRLSDDTEEPLIGIKKLMAEKMAESKRVIPHFSYFEEVEVRRLVKLRNNVRKQAAEEGISVTYIPFFLKALTLTIKEFPIINSSVDTVANKVVYHHHHNIGIAMSTKLGLIVPILKDVQNLNLEQMIRGFERLKQRAATNKLYPSEMKEGTISLSNFGALGGGGLWATPIINYPEVAILAVNRIQKRGDRETVNLSWSFDHRVIDGDLASRVSGHLAYLLSNPASLLG